MRNGSEEVIFDQVEAVVDLRALQKKFKELKKIPNSYCQLQTTLGPKNSKFPKIYIIDKIICLLGHVVHDIT